MPSCRKRACCSAGSRHSPSNPDRVEQRPTAMTVETERPVEASLRVGDDEQFDAITFSHGLGRKQAHPSSSFQIGDQKIASDLAAAVSAARRPLPRRTCGSIATCCQPLRVSGRARLAREPLPSSWRASVVVKSTESSARLMGSWPRSRRTTDSAQVAQPCHRAAPGPERQWLCCRPRCTPPTVATGSNRA